MSDDTPSPQRKGKAGITVVAIVLFMAVALFVGLSVSHSQKAEEPIEQQGPGQG